MLRDSNGGHVARRRKLCILLPSPLLKGYRDIMAEHGWRHTKVDGTYGIES